MNRVQLSGRITQMAADNLIWLETPDVAVVLTAVPKAYQEGLALLHTNDEISIEGTLWMAPASYGSTPPKAYGWVQATRMEAIRPSIRAKGANHTWRRLNSDRDRAEAESESYAQQIETLRQEASVLRCEKYDAEAATLQVKKDTQEMILQLVSGGTT